MTKKDISDAVTNINTEYIEKAADYTVRKRSGRPVFIKFGAAAACLALVIFAGTALFPRGGMTPNTELPMLSISEISSGMGFEGYMAYDISELVNSNPWEENLKISALPVYKNALEYTENFIAKETDIAKMREFALDIAGRLGLDTGALTVTDNAPDEETKQKIIEKMQKAGAEVPEGYFDPTEVTIKSAGFKITVNRAMTATVSFDTPVSLPEEYNFTFYASYDEKRAAAEYLKDRYGEFIGYEDPIINISGGDYNIYGDRSFSVEFFDVGDSDEEKIINYNFNRTAFYCDDNGDLFLIRIYMPDLSNKLGDYPIIGSEAAREMLLSGHYITTVPYELPGEEFIKKTELIYRTGEYEEYYMPYYRFYVELPEEERDNGLKTYGAYYVPAVEGTYISDMPTWDGSFN